MLTNAASAPDAEPPAESPPLEGYRLSPLQARLWHLQAADPDAYRARCVAEVHGPLDVDALQAALHAVVDRHEILRTTFPIVAGMSTAVQVIGGAAAPTISHRDLRALAPGDAASELEAIVEAAHRDPFDPGHDSPLRSITY
jgi:hypothetical protein